MTIVQLAGKVPWGELFLHDELAKREAAEKRHILQEGRDAEKDFKRKH